ncbi:MAG TPA: M15 family metallopeptidase [Frankiaceae bacterium]|nr:M15 family metallopeptidase [Frankiaceae bacterium]
MTPAARGRIPAFLLALGLAATAGCSAPGGRVAGGTRPAARAGSPAAATEAPKPLAVKPLKHRVRADVLIRSNKPLSPRVIDRLRTLTPRGVATFRSRTVTMGGKPLAVAGVDPSRFRAFAPAGTAEADAVWAGVGRHEVALSHEVAKERRIKLGSTILVGGKPLRVAAFATTLPEIDAVVSYAVADALRLPRANAAVLAAGTKKDPAALASAARKVAGKARIHLLTQPRTPYAFLTGSSAARAFGAFSYRWFEDGTIQPDARWVAANIIRAQVPILGTVTCHRLIVPQLRAAMREVEANGLATSVKTFDGCYVPRFIERNPDGAVSLHTWGIAFDLNATTNMPGKDGDMDMGVVNIMRKWGFRWGGDWSTPDPMHFELGILMQGVS